MSTKIKFYFTKKINLQKMCKIKLNNQMFYILILLRILCRSTNFVVGQAK